MKLFVLFFKSSKQPTETRGYIPELLMTTFTALKRLSLRHQWKFVLVEYILVGTSTGKTFFLKKTTLWPLFMDGVQLPQSYSHFEEAVVLISLYKTSTNLVNNKKLPVVTGSLQGFKKLSENITMFHSC